MPTGNVEAHRRFRILESGREEYSNASFKDASNDIRHAELQESSIGAEEDSVAIPQPDWKTVGDEAERKVGEDEISCDLEPPRRSKTLPKGVYHL
jgi:hypothetical protein